MKTYVLDTNVLLHDPEAIFAFEDNNVVIPITVLEELDNFKGKPGELGRNSRHVARLIDHYRDVGDLHGDGVKIGRGKGTLSIFAQNSEFRHAGLTKSNDNYIIGAARLIAEGAVHEVLDPDAVDLKTVGVTLVTKDVNMRIKADSLGIRAEDYHNDQIESVDVGQIVERQVSADEITMIHRRGELHMAGGSGCEEENQCVILSGNANSTALARCKNDSYKLVNPKKQIFDKITPRNAEQRFLTDMLYDPDIDLIVVNGVAGSGKTLLSLGAGLDMVRWNNYKFDRVTITKVVRDFGEGIGFLPGTKEEKMEEWVAPFRDNLEFLMLNGKSADIQSITDNDMIEVDALNYIRGRSLMNRFVIIDECQNLMPSQMKTIVSRLHKSSKLILLGDVQQIDNPYLSMTNNGLVHTMSRMQGLPNVACLRMVKTERSELAEAAIRRL